MVIEGRLSEHIGPFGGTVHTGRIRNDQWALDIRLYHRDQLDQLANGLLEFQRVLVTKPRGGRS